MRVNELCVMLLSAQIFHLSLLPQTSILTEHYHSRSKGGKIKGAQSGEMNIKGSVCVCLCVCVCVCVCVWEGTVKSR